MFSLNKGKSAQIEQIDIQTYKYHRSSEIIVLFNSDSHHSLSSFNLNYFDVNMSVEFNDTISRGIIRNILIDSKKMRK